MARKSVFDEIQGKGALLCFGAVGGYVLGFFVFLNFNVGGRFAMNLGALLGLLVGYLLLLTLDLAKKKSKSPGFWLYLNRWDPQPVLVSPWRALAVFVALLAVLALLRFGGLEVEAKRVITLGFVALAVLGYVWLVRTGRKQQTRKAATRAIRHKSVTVTSRKKKRA
jgi:hypothetical protein